MKYFKILRINYNDNLEAIYCKELETEEITNEDGTSRIFTKYKKIGYLYGDKVLEEEYEDLESKTIRAITEEDWKRELLKKVRGAEEGIEKRKKDIKENEKFKAELEAEPAELEKAEA